MRTEASVGIKNFTWALCSLELTGGGACCHLHVIYARRYHALGRRRWRSGRGPACQCRRRRRHEFSPWSEDLLEEGTATHSSIPAKIIPWTEEPGGLQTMHLTKQGLSLAFWVTVVVTAFSLSILLTYWTTLCLRPFRNWFLFIVGFHSCLSRCVDTKLSTFCLRFW